MEEEDETLFRKIDKMDWLVVTEGLDHKLHMQDDHDEVVVIQAVVHEDEPDIREMDEEMFVQGCRVAHPFSLDEFDETRVLV